MSEQIVTKPIIKDETGQDILDKLDEIISALSPNAQGVSFDKTGCEIITANNVQDGMKQLDSGLDTVSSNLAQLGQDLTYTGTTDSSGVLSPNPKIDATQITITSAYGTGSNIALPLVAGSDSSWRFKILSSSMVSQNNVTVTVHYTAVPKET